MHQNEDGTYTGMGTQTENDKFRNPKIWVWLGNDNFFFNNFYYLKNGEF